MKKIQLKSKMKRRYDFLNIEDMKANKVLLRDWNWDGRYECTKNDYDEFHFRWLENSVIKIGKVA